MIPKLSAPLTKLIRTGEGVLLFAFNAALIILPALNDVSFAKTLPLAAITNAVAFASRSLLKAVAAAKPAVGEPIPVSVASKSADEILAEIQAVADATAQFQSKPGTPATQVTAGLAPDDPASALAVNVPTLSTTIPAPTNS